MGDLVTGQLLLRSMSCCNLVYPYVEIKTRDVINGQYEGKINNSVLIDRIPLLIMDILILFLDWAVHDLSQMIWESQPESALTMKILQIEGPAEYFDDELAEQWENIRNH